MQTHYVKGRITVTWIRVVVVAALEGKNTTRKQPETFEKQVHQREIFQRTIE